MFCQLNFFTLFTTDIKKNKFFLTLLFFVCLLFCVIFCFYVNKEYNVGVDFDTYDFLSQKLDERTYLINHYDKLKKFLLSNHNIYGTLIALKLASKYFELGKIDNAIQLLKSCLLYTSDDYFRTVICLRWVHMEMEKRKLNIVPSILNKIDYESWINFITDIKGDLFMLQQKKQLALNSWKKSYFYEQDNILKNIIRMKINYVAE
ncbi:MAG: tetratricopeptide repeat protein [Buchnera aphidicola (Eriosoma harunire)]